MIRTAEKKLQIKLYEYQRQALIKLYENEYYGLIKLFCGLGKTIIAITSIVMKNAKSILICFPSRDLIY